MSWDLFSTLKSNFRDKGIPVVIGEFGSTDKNNTAERVKWATDYTALAKKNNIPCVLWDNNAFARYNGSSIILNGEYHGYINRKTILLQVLQRTLSRFYEALRQQSRS